MFFFFGDVFFLEFFAIFFFPTATSIPLVASVMAGIEAADVGAAMVNGAGAAGVEMADVVRPMIISSSSFVIVPCLTLSKVSAEIVTGG